MSVNRALCCALLFSSVAIAQNAPVSPNETLGSRTGSQSEVTQPIGTSQPGQTPVQTDAVKYAPRPLLLLSGENNVEAVMPMVFTANGQQHLEFVPASKIRESIVKGGQPIRLGDVLSVLGDATETINRLQVENNRLQAENEKLWKVATKDAPREQPPTIVVQQPAPPQPSLLERYMLLRSLFPQPQPYRLPMPVNPNANRLQTNCTTRVVGDTRYMDCH